MSDDEEDLGNGMFDEPEGFRALEKPATFAKYTLNDGQELDIRLVGFNPLWGHHLWNAGRIISDYLQEHVALCRDKTVLELGAGAGLPSLVAAILGASRVVLTDYPDVDLVENLQHNVNHACSDATIATKLKQSIDVKGYLWGSDVEPLLSSLTSTATQGGSGGRPHGFDLLILADLLFNHSEHSKLINTVTRTLKGTSSAKALVFFTPYRPWLLEKDLAFFPAAEEQGFKVTKLFEKVLEKVLFENDPGDELLRRTVFAYELTWAPSLRGGLRLKTL